MKKTLLIFTATIFFSDSQMVSGKEISPIQNPLLESYAKNDLKRNDGTGIPMVKDWMDNQCYDMSQWEEIHKKAIKEEIMIPSFAGLFKMKNSFSWDLDK